jgi:hypothetical protein
VLSPHWQLGVAAGTPPAGSQNNPVACIPRLLRLAIADGRFSSPLVERFRSAR